MSILKDLRTNTAGIILAFCETLGISTDSNLRSSCASAFSALLLPWEVASISMQTIWIVFCVMCECAWRILPLPFYAVICWMVALYFRTEGPYHSSVVFLYYFYEISLVVLSAWLVYHFVTSVDDYCKRSRMRQCAEEKSLEEAKKPIPYVNMEKKMYGKKQYVKNRNKRARMGQPLFLHMNPKEPQFGMSSVRDALTFQAAKQCIDALTEDEEFMEAEIEAIVNLIAIIRDSKSWVGVTNSIMLYVKRHYRDKALLRVVVEVLGDILPGFSNSPTPHDGAGEIEIEKNQFMSMLREFHGNWKMVKNNDAYEKLAKLIAVLTAAGIMAKTEETPTVCGIKLFADYVAPKTVSAIDIADAIIEATVYFFEGGYECIRTGSIKPLLFGDFEMRRFDELFTNCAHWMQYAQPGNLAMAGISQNHLDESLQETVTLGKRLVKGIKNPLNKRLIQERLVQAETMLAKFRQFRASGSLTERAYYVAIYGGTSVGKSTIGNYVMTNILKFNDFEADDEHTVVLNDIDKYMSNYRSFINGLFLDDIGNTKAEFVETSPAARILQIVNNVKTYANVAEAELKGKVVVDPKCVVSTSNLKDLASHTYSNEPVSIVRRANVVVTAYVKPEFAVNNQLNSGKVEEFYAQKGIPVPKIIDAWNFKVEVGYPIPSDIENTPATLGFKTVVWNGQPMQNIDIYTLLKFLYCDSKKHYSQESNFVAKNANLVEKLDWCEKCGGAVECCLCDQDMEHKVTYQDSTTYLPPPNSRKDRRSTPGPAHEVPQDRMWSSDGRNGENNPKSSITRKRFDRLIRRGKSKQQHCGAEPQWGFADTAAMNPQDPDYDPEVAEMERNAVRQMFADNMMRLNDLGAYLFGLIPFPDTMLRITSIVRMVTWFRRYFGPRFWVALSAQTFLTSMVVGILLPTCLATMIFCLFVFSSLSLYQWAVNARLELDVMLARPLWQPVIDRENLKRAALFAGVSAAIYGLYACAKKVRRLRKTPHGILMPSDEEIEKIDKNSNVIEEVKREQMWANLRVSALPTNHASKTTVSKDLLNMCKANMCYAEHELNGKMVGSTVFFLCSNVAVMPRHMWKERQMYMNFIRHDRDSIGGNFRSWISYDQCVPFLDTDLCLVYVPNGGSWRSLIEYLPRFEGYEPKKPVPMMFGYKKKDGSFASCKSRATFNKKTENGDKSGGEFGVRKPDAWWGWDYSLEFATGKGMCMGTLIADVKSPHIMGFHLGGYTGTPEGSAGILFYEEAIVGLQQLDDMPGVLVSASEGTLKPEQFGKKVFESASVHGKSCVRKLPLTEDAPNIKVYGSCPGRVTYYSEVVKSIISDHVEKICGVANKWGKPKFHFGDAFEKSLQHSSKPSAGIEPTVLGHAYADYVRPFLELLDARPALKRAIRPLTQMENICGIDGRKFIDKLPPNTSIGFPLSGPKSRYITRLPPELFEAFSCPATLDEQFWDEVAFAKREYVAGRRMHFVFKGCLKDEATPVDKDKVRVFQASPVVLQLLIREYFLPIARLISLFPQISECAVGINCMGDDWQELAEHMRKFGAERIVAGDYSKYDLRMPAQLTFAAFKVMIAIAEHCGYTDEELTIMRGIATDVCYPAMAYNGDLIQLIGSNPSGQNLTVYINSIVNSLLFRCAYYHLDMQTNVPFQERVSIMTYGDDVKGSVQEGFDEFNNVYLGEYFAQHDMVFTPPDKTSDHIPFRKDENSDFLKRKSVFCSTLDRELGALDEDSIWKSLHANIVSKDVSKEEHSAMCIDGALREWAAHGRDKYELRRTQMKEVAQCADITHMCTMLSVDYDEWARQWQERYKPECHFGNEDRYENFEPQANEIQYGDDVVIVDYRSYDAYGNPFPSYRAMVRFLRAFHTLDAGAIEDSYEAQEHLNFLSNLELDIASAALAQAQDEEDQYTAFWHSWNDIMMHDEDERMGTRAILNRLLSWQNMLWDAWQDRAMDITLVIYALWFSRVAQQHMIRSLNTQAESPYSAAMACELVPFDPVKSCNFNPPHLWYEQPFENYPTWGMCHATSTLTGLVPALNPDGSFAYWACPMFIEMILLVPKLALMAAFSANYVDVNIASALSFLRAMRWYHYVVFYIWALTTGPGLVAFVGSRVRQIFLELFVFSYIYFAWRNYLNFILGEKLVGKRVFIDHYKEILCFLCACNFLPFLKGSGSP